MNSCVLLFQNCHNFELSGKRDKNKGLASTGQPFVVIDGARGETRTRTAVKPGDFKSPVSTNSTTRAIIKNSVIINANEINLSTGGLLS